VVGSSRQAEDRRVDESSRQTQAVRQTEAPKPADSHKQFDTAKGEAKSASQRQPEPQRQAEPQRQHEPQRQAAPGRQDNSGHWNDPGPAWRSNGPAWRDQNDRPNAPRPGEDAFRSNGNTYAPRNGDRRRDRDSRYDRGRKDNSNTYYSYPYIMPFGFGAYVPSAIQLEPAPAPAPAAPSNDEPPLGFLQLRVQPRTAEVYVDGALAGTVDDFGGRGARMVPAGPHRVEIVAPGYETLTFDVRVPENDTVTFTRELEPAVQRSAPPPVVIPHKALYVVPQCYIGDRPPLPSDMPAGCRVEDVRVIP
jgi:hypothetical protein